MKRKYRIFIWDSFRFFRDLDGTVHKLPPIVTHHTVQVRKWWGWTDVKDFTDDEDPDFAAMEADELLELLNA